MGKTGTYQLSQLLKNTNPNTIFNEVNKIFNYYYPKKSFSHVMLSYTLIKDLFAGKFPGYKACNTEYHDFSHVMDSILSAARLLDGYNLVNDPFPPELAANLLCSVQFQYTGYIQEGGDDNGTGAKHTSNHIERSLMFLNKAQKILDFDKTDIDKMANLIKCSGLIVDFKKISFSSNEEKTAGSILGSADLLGQMASRIYLEKLLFLYREYKEANIPGINTEFDILSNTVKFYKLTKKRYTKAYGGVYKYAKDHFLKRFDIDSNLYVDSIERNISYIHEIIKDRKTNFRHKLKRADWVDTF